MKRRIAELVACSSLAIIAASSSAFAQDHGADKDKPVTAWDASRKTDDNDMVTTGVARGRDRLDSATSTSAIKENEINRIAPRSMAELFRNIPGIRVEASGGDANNNYTVRGLPMVSNGAKYLQIQEDGLPVMEFGDIQSATSDSFTRVDFNVGQVEAIRGGSASTFASNAPGAVINLISKTGEVEGGSAQATAGLDYQSFRTDFDYGGHLSDTWRFHLGGFFREGEGQRTTGTNSYRGGQFKFNATKQIDGGYIRFYGKFLDDRTPLYQDYPVAVTGTNAQPHYQILPGFSATNDTLLSRNIPTINVLDPGGQLGRYDLNEGDHAIAKSLGVEAQFKIGEWNISERLRYSDMSGSLALNFVVLPAQPANLAAILHIPAASFSYANGPLAGTAFNPALGNGLLTMSVFGHYNFGDLSNVTNDIRTSRVWHTGGGDLTTTAGIYKANQKIKSELGLETVVQDIVGGGNSSLINVSSGPFMLSTNGVFLGMSPSGNSAIFSKNVDYSILAPYGSFNFHKGRVAIGGSVRYDHGDVSGTTALAGPANVKCVDINSDGTTTPGTAECKFGYIPNNAATPVKYSYGYLSYSAGINLRVSEPFAVFARYSRGARAGADHILSNPPIDANSGALTNTSAAFDPVRQAEAGLKFRKNGITLNLTGFYALTSETNTQVQPVGGGLVALILVQRSYKAYGVEFEGGFHRGPFSVTAGATVTGAQITKAEDPTLVGHLPRHQPTLLYSLTPQYDSDSFTVGLNVVGQTGSYAQDTNQLRLPGYTTVGAFIQYRPAQRIELSVNASNLFNTLAITGSQDSAINPLTNLTLVNTLNGRTISTSARFFF